MPHQLGIARITFVLLSLVTTSSSQEHKQDSATQGTGPRQETKEDPVAAVEIIMGRLARGGGIPQARQDLLSLVKANPKFAEPRFHLGVLSEMEEDWTEAIRWLKEFRALDSSSEKSIKTQYEIDKLKILVEIDRTPDGKKKRKYEESVQRITLLLNAGQLQPAFAEAGNAASIDPNRWESYALAAAALSRRQLFDDAEQFMQKAIDRAPDIQRGELNQALMQCRTEKKCGEMVAEAGKALDEGKYAAAAELFLKAWAVFPLREKYGLAAGTARAMEGNYAAAADILTKLREATDPSVARNARDMLSRLSSRGAVVPPKSVADKHDEAASTLLSEQKVAEAEARYREASRKEPNDAKWHSKLGSSLARQKKWNEAEDAFRQAVRLMPENIENRLNLAAVYMQQGKWSDAIEEYKASIARDPKNATLFDHLGTACHFAGNREEAVKAYSKAVELDPDNDTFKSHLAESRK